MAAAASSGSGGDFLERKSSALQARHGVPKIADVIIIDDEAIDADRMLATLRVMFGYDVVVRRAASISAALTLVGAHMPDLIFLDDILKPSDDAVTSVPALRRAGFAGPIIVVSGQVTRKRKPTLLAAGATDVIHKDDVDSLRLTETLQRIVPTNGA